MRASISRRPKIKDYQSTITWKSLSYLTWERGGLYSNACGWGVGAGWNLCTPCRRSSGAEFANSWRSGVRLFTLTRVGTSRKSTCWWFELFLESYLWRGKVKFGIICDLGVTFNNDLRIVKFTTDSTLGGGEEGLKSIKLLTSFIQQMHEMKPRNVWPKLGCCSISKYR